FSTHIQHELPTHFPYTTLFRSQGLQRCGAGMKIVDIDHGEWTERRFIPDEAPGAGDGKPNGQAGSAASAGSTAPGAATAAAIPRSEEDTSELQSPYDLVCRLLL